MSPSPLFAFFGFDAVGPAELLVLFAVVLIVVGPKNLPAAARKMGSFMASLRRAADEFKRQLMTMDVEDPKPSTKAADPEPPPPPPPDPPKSDTYIDVPPAEGTDSPEAYGVGDSSTEPSESPVPDSEFEPPPDVQAADECRTPEDDANGEEKK